MRHETNARLIRKQANRLNIDEYVVLQGQIDWGGSSVYGPAQLRERKTHSEDTVTLIMDRIKGVPVQHFRHGELVPLETVRGVSLMFTMLRTEIVTRYGGPLPPVTCLIEEMP